MLAKGIFEGSPLQDSPAARSKSAPKEKAPGRVGDKRTHASVKLRKRERSAEAGTPDRQGQHSIKNSVVVGRQSLQLGRVSGLDASTHIGVPTGTATANSSFWGGIEPVNTLQIAHTSTVHSGVGQQASGEKLQRWPPKIPGPGQTPDILDSLERLEQQYRKKTALLTAELQKATTAHARDIDLWQQERVRHEEKQKLLEEQVVKLRNELEQQRVEKTTAIEKLKKTLKNKEEKFEKAFGMLEEKAKECIAAEKAQFETKLAQLNEGWKLKMEKATFELSSSACLQLESSRKELEALKRDLDGLHRDKETLKASNSALAEEIDNLKHKPTKEQGIQANTIPDPPLPPKTQHFSSEIRDESVQLMRQQLQQLEQKVEELGEVVKEKEEASVRQKRDFIGLRDMFREYVRSQLSLKRGVTSMLDGAD